MAYFGRMRREVGYSGGITPPVYPYPNPSISRIFEHKLGGKHKKDILAGLGILGPSTVYSLAKFIIEKETKRLEFKFKDRKGEKFHVKKISKRKDTYYKIVNDRHENGEEYKGLISKGFVGRVSISTTKNDLYFLTLKGCILTLGFKFENDDLKKFIKNAGLAHFLFAYINKVMEETSVEFIKEIFVKPISLIIEKGKINFDDDLRFFFSNIVESIGYAISQSISFAYKKMDLLNKIRRHDSPHVTWNKMGDSKYVEILINNTWYEPSKDHIWNDKMFRYFYPNDDWISVSSSWYNDLFESDLLWKTMREIHLAYYSAHGIPVAVKHEQKFPFKIKQYS